MRAARESSAARSTVRPVTTTWQPVIGELGVYLALRPLQELADLDKQLSPPGRQCGLLDPRDFAQGAAGVQIFDHALGTLQKRGGKALVRGG